MKELLKYMLKRIKNCESMEDLKDLRRDFAIFMRFLDKMPTYTESELIEAFINEEEPQDGLL